MTKTRKILGIVLAVMILTLAMSISVFAGSVAKIGDTEYDNFNDAYTAANAMTGDVVVEIYDAVEFVDGMELKGSYSSITFIGVNDASKITINQSAGGDYLEAHGKIVFFNDLILAKANPAWSGNSGHMGNYFSIQGGTVTYNDCIFPNGACTNTGTAIYNNCVFENASEYGLWVYDDALVTVNGGTIDSKKGIKVYSEGETSVTSTLTVQNATFTENVTAKPAVAIGYAAEITLIGNNYNNTTGVLELDSGSDADCEGITFVAQDAEGNDIASTLTAVDRSNSNSACGVLVDGKIYTTATEAAKDAVAGSTVTLLFDSTETVEFAEGVTLDTNGHTAENVTVVVSVPVEVATYDELVAALNAGKDVVLTADIVCPDKATLKISNQTLDLGGYTLTLNGESGKLENSTIKNGTIEITTYTGDTVADGIFDVYGTSKVEGVTVYSEKCAIYAIFDIKTGTLDMTDCKINIANNSSSGGLIYFNGGEKLTMTGCAVTGTDIGDFITNGEAVLTNCTVTLKGTKTGALDNGFNGTNLTFNNTSVEIDGATGRGITTDGDAIAITGGSNVVLTNCAEGGIRYKASATITVDDTSKLSGTVKVDSAATNAKINETAVAVTSTELPNASVENGSVTVKYEPKGTINGGLVNLQDANRTFLTIESYIAYANESIVVKVYDANGTLLATSSLVDNDRVLLGKTNFGLSTMVGINCTDSWWNTTWEADKLRADYVPATATLFVDGVEMNTANIQMRTAAGETEVNWADVPGVPPAPVAEINGVGYATFAEALNAASKLTGDVVVEILDKVTLNTSLSGSYDSITFVGKDTDAEIYLDVQGYITATGKKVAFEDLILSKVYGEYMTNAGFMNVAFGVYDVTEVTYTNCTFANGAYASSGKVTFTGCTFHRSHEKYGLWAYGNVDVTVDGCTFAIDRGIKMYAEGAAKTVELTVKDTDFSAVTAKPAIVLTYGASVELEGNTYSSAGVFELDKDGAPNGTTITADIKDIACMNDNYTDCGVIVDGKIYVTVTDAVNAGTITEESTVTLMYNSTETVELPKGVTLDKNGYTATGVTVKKGLDGTGTAEDPYLINNLEDLIWFRDHVNTCAQDGSSQYNGKFVKLTADIDLAGINWTPIGSTTKDHGSFYGTFDGDGHTIYNLYVEMTGTGAGFFAKTSGGGDGPKATIKNITFNNVNVSSDGSYVGGVIANAGGNTEVSNVKVTGDVKVSGYGYVGGIVGHGYPDMYNCSVEANDGSYVRGGYWCVGGIVGYAGEGGTIIKDCSVKNIDVHSVYGGAAAIAGLLQDGNNVENVTAENVEITSNSDYCMGYIAGNGEASTLTNVTVKDVTATANGKPITVTDAVASVNDELYFSLEEAFAAADEGDTIVLLADATPALKSQRAITKASVIDLNGKTLTLTEDDLYFGTTTFKNGTIVVDPSVKPSTAVFWMFANQTLTFDAVKLVATGVTGTYLIGLDGNNADLNIVNGSEIIADNETALDLDIICVNSSTGNDIVVHNSKVTVNNLDGRVFFRGNYTISGASEINLSGITKAGFRIEAGQTLSIEDTSVVTITGEPRDGGIHVTDATATYTKADTATVTATVNVPVEYVAQIGDVKYETLADAFAAIGAGDVVIELLKDATLDYNAREAYGLAGTTSVTINGNGHVLTLNQKDSDWSSIGLANADAKLVLKNMTIEKTGYGDTSGAWNTHAIIFKCNVEMTDAIVNNSVAVQNGATLNNVTINEANGYYGLWINANGQSVTMNGGAINATNGGRGIKVADQYVDSVAKVELSITGTKFNTANKAAVLVTSPKGANITASNVDITNVAADNTSLVWVDETYAANFGETTVVGGTVSQEDASNFAIIVKDGDKAVSYFKTLDELFDNVSAYAKVSNVTVELLGDVVATKVVKTNSLKTYNFVTNVAEGVTMDLQYADGWNYFRKVNIGENITVKVKYLVFSTESTIAGTVDAYYPYINGGKVTVAETGTLKYAGGDALQVKGNGAVLTVKGTVIAPTINVWVGNAQLVISGENAKVESNWIDIWDGAPTVTVENGATLDVNKIKVSRGGEITVDNATLDANSIEVGHNGNSAGKLTESGNSTINGEIKMTATGSTVASDGGLNVTTSIADHKVVYEDGEYKVVPCVYVAQVGETKYESLADAVAYANANGGTVTLLGNIELSESIKVTGTVTLDLNGYAITGTDNNVTGNFYLIDNVGTLTVTDSSEDKTGKITLTATTNRVWNNSSVVIANNPGGKLTVESGTIEHLGGTNMAYGIDNLTNGKGTYAETVINGGTIKSAYIAVRQFLNGIEAQNILTINGGTIDGANSAIYFQSPSAEANTGTLIVKAEAVLTNRVYLGITDGTTEWPVEISIAAGAFAEDVATKIAHDTIPDGYEIVETNGIIGVEEKAEEKIDVKYFNVDLGTDLAINFAYVATDFDEDLGNYYAVIKKCHIEGCDHTSQTYYVSGESFYLDSNGYVQVKASSIAASEMVCDIEITIYKGTYTTAEDGTVTENGIAVSNTYTASVVKFVEKAIDAYASIDNKEELYALMADMLVYGAEAQKVFKHTNTVLATEFSTKISEFVEQYSTEYDDEGNYVVPDMEKSVTTEESTKYYAGFNVDLEHTIFLNLYFQGVDMSKDFDAKIKFTHHNGDVHEYSVKAGTLNWKNNNGFLQVNIDDLAPADLRLDVECIVLVPNSEGTLTEASKVILSVEDYVAAAKASGKTDGIYDAILRYADSAKSYFYPTN